METSSLAAAAAALDEQIKEEVEDAKPTSTEKEAEKKNKQEEVVQLEVTAAEIMIAKVKAASGVTEVKDADKERITEAESEVAKIFEANCSFGVIPDSVKKAKAALDKSPAAQFDNPQGKFTGVLVDPALMGEPVTAPHLRTNVVNGQVLKEPY